MRLLTSTPKVPQGHPLGVDRKQQSGGTFLVWLWSCLKCSNSLNLNEPHKKGKLERNQGPFEHEAKKSDLSHHMTRTSQTRPRFGLMEGDLH